MNEEDKLQELCRHYLSKLKCIANKHGLGKFIDDTIKLNKQDKCHGTKVEVELLARACDDERLTRQDVPKILGKSYRQCNDDEDFERIKKLKRVGIYSKIDTLLYKNK